MSDQAVAAPEEPMVGAAQPGRDENQSPTPEPTDDELREHLAAARRRVTVIYDPAEVRQDGRPVKQPVQASEAVRHIPRVTTEPMQRDAAGQWEPVCVSCGAPLGYFAKHNCYAEGRTLCATCRGDHLAARLQNSGISYRELEQPLDALVRPSDDPTHRAAVDAKTLRERDKEFERYLAFLRRFAALKPGERITPPFAFVYGNLGTGKSAGAERAMRDAITNGCSGRCVRFSDLLRKIYDTYRGQQNSTPDSDRRDYSTEDVIRTYSSAHLLLIHEVGQDADTDHALGLFFDFVDDRHQAMLPTIFTSNYAPDNESIGARMGVRAVDNVRVRGIVDRISGGVGHNVFCLLGPSWRGRSAA